MGIAQTILLERKRFHGLSLQEINNGNCGEFAHFVASKISNAVSMWGDEICPLLWGVQTFNMADWFTHFSLAHAFIMFENKFYDSECPQGCNYPDELPFFQREITEFYSGKKKATP